jgi:hypothetical protein
MTEWKIKSGKHGLVPRAPFLRLRNVISGHGRLRYMYGVPGDQETPKPLAANLHLHRQARQSSSTWHSLQLVLITCQWPSQRGVPLSEHAIGIPMLVLLTLRHPARHVRKKPSNTTDA